MGKSKDTITEQDIQDLLKARMKNPDLSYEDIYKGIDEIHPTYNKQIFKKNWLPCLCIIASSISMVIWSSTWEIKRIAFIGYLISSVFFIRILSNFGKKIWWWILLIVALWYISYFKVIEIKELWELISGLL